MKHTSIACLVAAVTLSMGNALAAAPTYQMKVASPVKSVTADTPAATTPATPPAPVIQTIVATATARNWADGSFAKSCKAYLVGDATHQYAGATGSGVYTIAPLGTAVSTYCDMTTDGGGWTLTAYNRGTSGVSLLKADFFVSSINAANIGNRSTPNTAASINVEAVSVALNTKDVMLVAPSYSASPIIEKNQGTWNYNSPDCSGVLGHTGRNAGCGNHQGNDNWNSSDRFNIAIYGMGYTAIVPTYLNEGQELCWQNRGWCSFEFYVR